VRCRLSETVGQIRFPDTRGDESYFVESLCRPNGTFLLVCDNTNPISFASLVERCARRGTPMSIWAINLDRQSRVDCRRRGQGTSIFGTSAFSGDGAFLYVCGQPPPGGTTADLPGALLAEMPTFWDELPDIEAMAKIDTDARLVDIIGRKAYEIL
jgi:hypothetical protein